MSKLHYVLFFSLAHASCSKLPGTMVCENVTESEISASGNVILKRVEVLGDTNVKGQLQVEDSKLSSLDMFGLLRAQDTTFQGEVAIYGNQAHITGGSTQNIRMSGDGAGQENLVLTGNLTVNGDISFSDDKGIVLADNSVQIRGKVIGGVLKKRGV